MKALIDSSILVAAMVEGEAFHAESRAVILTREMGLYAHGLAETFSTLSGGRKPFRLSASVVSLLLEEHFAPCLQIQSLTPTETLRALREAESRGVRGGAVFDYLHLVAARKAKAQRFYTLNVNRFTAFRRAGDPDIVHP